MPRDGGACKRSTAAEPQKATGGGDIAAFAWPGGAGRGGNKATYLNLGGKLELGVLPPTQPPAPTAARAPCRPLHLSPTAEWEIYRKYKEEPASG